MKTFTLIITIVLILGFNLESIAQVGVGTSTPTPSATLEVSSQINGAGDYKGLMPPRVATETERNSIATTSVDKGLLVFVNDTGCLDIYNGTSWEHITCDTGIPPSPPPPPTVTSGETPSTAKVN